MCIGLKIVAYCTHIVRLCANFENIAVCEKISGTRFESVLHKFFLVNILFVDNNYALTGKHKRNTARGSHIAAELIKIMTHIACGSVAVICKSLNYYGDTRRTVALIDYAFVIIGIAVSGSLFNDSFDIIVRNIASLRLSYAILKL